MTYTILGILLIFAPFILIFSYSSILEGIYKIGLWVSVFTVSISVLTQIFHIFTYPVLIVAFVVFDFFIIFFQPYKKSMHFNFSMIKKEWIVLPALIIIFLQLYTIHYSFTGTVQTLQGQKQVEDSTYSFPFVSDEWVTISLSNYSISNQSLPVVNPFDHNQPFPNILFAFSSLLAGFFLLLGLSPLIHYSVLSIFFAILLCFSMYALLRKYGVSSYIGVASMLCTTYIANSGNLPALWSLLPFNIGLILLLWQLISQKSLRHDFALGYMILGLLIYPPIVVFSLPVFLISILNSENKKNIMLHYVTPITVCLFIAFGIFYFILNPSNISLLDILFVYIFRPNPDSAIVSYGIWSVLPVYLLLLSLFGIYRAFRERHFEILTVLGIGLIFWCSYAFINRVFVIEYPRIVVITSVFIIFFIGISLERLSFTRKWISFSISILAIIVSVLLLSSYGVKNKSLNFPILFTDQSSEVKEFAPAAAVNRYLTRDELVLFKDLKNETFIAPPWKALVIAATTSNFPLETKASTISNNFFSYAEFVRLNCVEKNAVANYFRLGYVYSTQFSCPDFTLIGSSREGLFLYKYK